MQDAHYKSLASDSSHRNGDSYRRSPTSTPTTSPPAPPLNALHRSRSSRRKSKERPAIALSSDPRARRPVGPSGGGEGDTLPPPSQLFNRGCVNPQNKSGSGSCQRTAFLGFSRIRSKSNLVADLATPSSDPGLSPESRPFPLIQSDARLDSSGLLCAKPYACVDVHPAPPPSQTPSILAPRRRSHVKASAPPTSHSISTSGHDPLSMGTTSSCEQHSVEKHPRNGSFSSRELTTASSNGTEGEGGMRSTLSSFTKRLFLRSNSSPVRTGDGGAASMQGTSPATANLRVSGGSPVSNGAAAAVEEIDDATWVFTAPPNNQRTFFFPEDNLEFSSEFDSGNLIQVERAGPLRYTMYTAMDCGNAPCQTNNRQWFHFSVRGGTKGAVVSVTMVGMMHSNMFSFDWMPVMAVVPGRPQYTRLPGKATVVSVETMPPTPGYPLLVYRPPAARAACPDNDGEDDVGDDFDEETPQAVAFTVPMGGKAGGRKKKRKKKDQAMNLTFEFKVEVEAPLDHPRPPGHPDCPAIYIASNHPYSYATLQRNIMDWHLLTTGRARSPSSATSTPDSIPLFHSVGPGTAASANPPPHSSATGCHAIYFHRETLCKTLEGRKVELLTISDLQGVQKDRLPMLASEGQSVPYSSGAAGLTQRPFRFIGKQYVVLSARVHPGECAGSHIMHGCLEFLMSPKDPRAIALRQRFVFFIVPMLNPDGVARGHSRADACGVDLNRMYSNPSPKRHPAPYCLRMMLNTYAREKKLALFIDMHAHANKKGTFFYGNGMGATDQVQNLLYGKLVSMNTPYFEFLNCNYSESNMFAVGKAGRGKDSSSRVVLFHDTGFIHSYTIEASHVAGKSTNVIPSLSGIPGEERELPTNTTGGARYCPETFGDTGKALLLALLDLKNANPVSRIPLSPYGSTKGVALWLQRQMQIEAAEKLFAQAYREHGKVEPTDPAQSQLAAIMHTLTEDDVPDKLTLRNTRSLPPTTFTGLREFLPIDLAVSLLAQTPPSGLPRSAVCKTRSASPSATLAPAAVLGQAMGGGGGADVLAASPPPVIAARRAPKPSHDSGRHMGGEVAVHGAD